MRRVNAATRSDPVGGLDIYADDINCYAGKVEYYKWKLVGEGKGHSDELLHSARVDALSPEDRNLTTALVMGVLRWQIALDARVRSERPCGAAQHGKVARANLSRHASQFGGVKLRPMQHAVEIAKQDRVRV